MILKIKNITILKIKGKEKRVINFIPVVVIVLAIGGIIVLFLKLYSNNKKISR